MNNNIRIYTISIVIALVLSSLICFLFYALGNNTYERLHSFNQKIVLEPETFVGEMNKRLTKFISNFKSDMANLDLRIKHELKLNPSITYSSGDFTLFVDKSLETKFVDVFYDLFKEDFLISRFNEYPHFYSNEFKSHYHRIYNSNPEISDFLANQNLSIINVDENIDFKNFIQRDIVLNIYFESTDYKALRKLHLENRIATLYFERYMINEFYKSIKDYLIQYVSQHMEDTKSTIKIYKKLVKKDEVVVGDINVTVNDFIVEESTSVSENIDMNYILNEVDEIEEKITSNIASNNIFINENFYPVSMRILPPSILLRVTSFSLIAYIIFFLFNIIIIYFISLYFLKKIIK